MRNKRHAVVGWSLLAVFCIALSFPFLWLRKPTEGMKTPGPEIGMLASLLPIALSGWKVYDLPLGETELIRSEVKRRLNYSDYVFRRFERDGVYFEIYAARWDRGSIPVRMLSAHTPDNCWTSSGWRCLDMRFRQELKVDNRSIHPAEWRLFSSPSGVIVHVWFWHFVENQLYDNGARFNQSPHPLTRLRDLYLEMRKGDPAQFFVRFTSNVDFSRLCLEKDFCDLVRRLGSEGLYQ